MCNCHSHTQGNGSRPEVLVPVPIFVSMSKQFISIDACISYVIKYLWANDVVTINCCCGHNKHSPSIIFEQDLDKVEGNRIRELIAQIDEREFELLSWNLVHI